MIYYFSGTGNSKWIAQEVAKATQDRAISIVEAVKRPVKLQTEAAEVFGLVFPVFAWRLPLPVRNFLKNRKKTAAYSFAVATCEGEYGDAFKEAAALYPFDSCYALAMANNYFLYPWEDTSDVHRRQLITAAQAEIKTIAQRIHTRASDPPPEWLRGPGAALKTNLIGPAFMATRSDRKFFVEKEKCISCGLCAENCPLHDIRLTDGKPVWQHQKCVHCCACIANCPVQAIEYGRQTVGKPRYTLEHDLKRLF